MVWRGLRGSAKRGLTRILVEGGATLATAFLEAGLVDRLYWFRPRGVIGGDGLPGIGAAGRRPPGAGRRLRCVAAAGLGNDVLELYGGLPRLAPPRR